MKDPNEQPADSWPGINPATLLPMLNEYVDVGGNPYGTDFRDPHWDATSPLYSGDDHFGEPW